MTAPRRTTGGVVLVVALGGPACHYELVDQDTRFMRGAPSSSCEELAQQEAVQTVWATRFIRYGDRYLDLYPSDAIWIIDLEYRNSRDVPPLSMTLDSVTLACGKRTSVIPAISCAAENGLRVYAFPHAITPRAQGALGYPSECQVKTNVRYEDGRQDSAWDFGVLLREGLADWFASASDPVMTR